MHQIQIGDKFGMLEVIAGPTYRANHAKYWTCRCDCGTVKEVYQHRILTGTTKSCGCTKFVSEETKALLSELRRSQPAPRPKGSRFSEESKAKMKASQLARRERERQEKENPQRFLTPSRVSASS